MSKQAQEWYRQCRFRSDRNRIETAWIPEESAKTGKRVYFKDDGWDETEIWTIEAVYGRRSKDWVLAHQQDHLHQRKVSDI